MRIAILQADSVDEMLHNHSGGDYPAMFKRLFDATGCDLEMGVYNVTQGQLPEYARDYDGYLITGSRNSANDNHPWIVNLKDFILRCYLRKRKMIGICFGHQIIAAALGGKVERSQKGWGIGLQPIQIRQKCSWMQPPCDCCNLIFSHQDQVTALPKNADILACSEHCAIQMYCIENLLLGIQGHPEMTVPHIEALMHRDQATIGPERVTCAWENLKRLQNDGEVLAHWLVQFLQGQ